MRYALLKDKLRGGDVFMIAEALRDMAWRKEQRKGLTTEGARLYEHSMNFLSAEIAIAQGSDFADAEIQISRTLTDSIDTN
jgi:RNA polymerase-interacting CarD/CdnL/TRCF family regulator